MSKIVKNTTGIDVVVQDVGVTIPASGQYILNKNEYHLWGDSLDIITLIDGGTLIINDGVTDLSIDRAKDFISENDFAFSHRFLSQPERVNGFNSKNVQEAIEESRTTFEGKGFQTTFAGNGTFRNSWMSQEDTNVESDESPDIFKYGARLVGIDFTNQNQNVDCIIKIAIRSYPFSNLNTFDRSYKWTLDNVRSAVKVSQLSGFEVNAGDCMAVYLQDTGGNANDVILTMDFITLSAPTTDIQFSYSGNFQSNDFPNNNSIPEILQ